MTPGSHRRQFLVPPGLSLKNYIVEFEEHTGLIQGWMKRANDPGVSALSLSRVRYGSKMADYAETRDWPLSGFLLLAVPSN